MRFREYMREWLYGAQGYYARYRPIGKGGDFYTAVSTSKFFGGTIALHILRRIDEGALDPKSLICEIGAHHGYLLADMIEFLHTLRPELLETLRFGIVERFETLREAQARYFEESFGSVITLEHYADVTEVDAPSIFYIANEIFDAFECELLYEGRIARVEEHEVHFVLEDRSLLEHAARYHQTKGEIAQGYEAFAHAIAHSGTYVELMSFDYGEWDVRNEFSLRLYHRHQTHPFFEEGLDRAGLFGRSDITYDVHFEHVSDAFEGAGMERVAYTSQLVALVEMGITQLLEMLREHADEAIYTQEVEKVKILIDPSKMGERFKMIRFVKGAHHDNG